MTEHFCTFRYVLLAHDCDIERVWLTALFPNLRVLIETHDNRAVDDAGKLLNEPNIITIWVYLPVSCTLLFWHVLPTPMRQSIDSQAFLETPASVRTIYLCHDSGYVYGHPSLDAHTGLQKPVLLAPRIIKLTEMLTSHSPKHSDPLALEITNLTLTQRFMMALFGVLEVAGHSKKVLEERSEMTTADQARTFPESPCLFLQLHPEELDYLVAKVSANFTALDNIHHEVTVLRLTEDGHSSTVSQTGAEVSRYPMEPAVNKTTIFDIPQEIALEYLRERIDILLECYIKHPHMFPTSETVDWATNIRVSAVDE
jgi:hypothetical protein